MQHDVFWNPAPRSRTAFPFVVLLQADVVEIRRRIIAPMAPTIAMPGVVGRIAPVVRHAGQDFFLVLELMTTVPAHALREPLGSIAAYRDDITRALDWLFTGI